MKRYTFCSMILAVVAGLAAVMASGRQTPLPEPRGIVRLTARIIEKDIKDSYLRGSVIDLLLLLDEYERSEPQMLRAGFDREIKIAQAARRVFAMYETDQNNYGFDSALAAESIVSGVLGLALETVNQALADERAPTALRDASEQMTGYFLQVISGEPIKRAGLPLQ